MNIIKNEPAGSLRSQRLGELMYRENKTHIIIGPYRTTDSDACFQCFVSTLRQNKSSYLDIVEDDRLTETYFEKIKQDLKDIVLPRNEVVIIHKATHKLSIKKIRKDVFCPLCRDHVAPGKTWSWSNSRIDFGESGRIHAFAVTQQHIDEAYDFLIDSDTGIGKSVFRDVESDVIPMYGIQSFLGAKEYYSYGRTKSLLESKYISCLEMMERYSSIVPHFKDTVFGSYTELKALHPVVHPASLHLTDVSSAQPEHPIKPFHPDQSYHWTECFNIGTGSTVLLPEQAVYYDNQFIRQEERFLYETSNGTALGGSFEEAVMYSLFELIERDAFLVHWYARMNPKRIHVNPDDDEDIATLLATMKRRGFDVHLFDITLETGFPVVWAMAVNQKADANLKIYNAAGCHFYARNAVKSALVEVVSSTLIYDKVLQHEKSSYSHLVHAPHNVQSMEDHVNYYAFEEHFESFSDILDRLDERETVVLSEMDQRLTIPFTYEAVIHRMLSHHPDIYVADLSNYVTNEAKVFVTKAIVPTMQPMTFGMNNERINEERIGRFLMAGTTRNKAPHPFP